MSYLSKKLVQLGLSNFESQVYLGLLQRQSTTAGALAKFLAIKRSTVYTILDSLMEKGMVNTTQVEAVRHYLAEPPERLGDLLQRDQAALIEKQKLYREIASDLSALGKQKLKPPKITIYEGKASIKNLLQRNLDDCPKEVLVIGEYAEEKDPVPEYTRSRIEKKIPTRIVIPETKFGREEMRAKDQVAFRKTHLVDHRYRFPASIHIYDKSVAVFTHTKAEAMGVYIENQDICDTMRMVFEIVEEGISGYPEICRFGAGLAP